MSRWRDYLTGFCQAFDWLYVPDIQGYPHRNEAEALEGDWRKVGDAMQKVIGELESTIKKETDRVTAGKTTMRDVPPGAIAFTAERVGDEWRETFYIRDPDRPCRYPENVPAARKGFVQAEPYAAELRCVRILKTPCRDPGEIDGRTPVWILRPGTSHFYDRVFENQKSEATA